MDMLKCPKCGGEMVDGHLQAGKDYAGNDQVHFTQEGAPKTRTDYQTFESYELNRVRAHRCNACGYLELYVAPNPTGI